MIEEKDIRKFAFEKSVEILPTLVNKPTSMTPEQEKYVDNLFALADKISNYIIHNNSPKVAGQYPKL